MSRPRVRRRAPLLAWLAVAVGCATPGTPDPRDAVSGQLRERTGHDLGPAGAAGDVLCPPGVDWQDGLTEEEAIGLALWNNALFQETLADIGVARSDLIQAGLLPDPELWLLAPVGVKQLEFAVEFPVEALYLRPMRVRNARLEEERTAERLAQAGLDLIRDARLAYAEAQLAHERRRIADEALRLRGHIAELAEARLRAGDASPLEVATVRVDALRARQEADRAVLDVALAEERFRHILGIGAVRAPISFPPQPDVPGTDVNPDALVQEAVVSRPDARSAIKAVEAADERVRLARSGVVNRLAGIVDANDRGDRGFEAGPGFRVMLPLWNRNRGVIARAEAERERLFRQRATLHDRIILETRQAHLQYFQARQELVAWRQRVRPAVEDAIGRAEKSYKEGGTALLLVLETSRQLIDARAREAQLRADVRRAWAELERSVGRRLRPGGTTLPQGGVGR